MPFAKFSCCTQDSPLIARNGEVIAKDEPDWEIIAVFVPS